MNRRRVPRVLLAAVVAAYVAIAVLYAVYTPVWQVPDEPAHYNYVRALAEDGRFPVMEPGDYDSDYLELLKNQDFPPGLSVDSLEYEDHQLPLYYLLAAPVYLLFGGAVLPLRLISVLFGAALLAVAYATVRAVFPERPELALVAAAFIAFIPQHVAMTAGVSNDALTELVIGSTLWALVVYVGGERDRPWHVGLLLAAALLTKVSAWVVVVVAAAAVAVRWRREGRTWRWAARQLLWMLIPALLLFAPWFVRGGLTYGWHDPLARARHDEVVAGQMRLAEYLDRYGWAAYWDRAWNFTFHSFWGQFGWMEVVLPNLIYQALLLFSAGLVAGFLWWLFGRRRPRLTPHQRVSLLLFLISSALTLIVYVRYNMIFVQHQGRYLFPAVIPIGTAAALGLSKLASLLPSSTRAWAMAALFSGLAALDVYCLFKSIPYLTP